MKDSELKVMVTGANGQLGKDLVNLFQLRGNQVFGFGRDQVDITDRRQVSACIQDVKPDVVIHAAAYTKVDLAESEPDDTYRINAYGTRNVAIAAEQAGSRLVYVSTDYVFDGNAAVPYHEFSPVNPSSVYGRSKWAGEQFVKEFHSKWFIVRTSWVYGQHGHNFVKTMLRLAKEQPEVRVVSDQIGCPTYTVDLTECISRLVETDLYGTYHVSNSGYCSWYEFAATIFELANSSVTVTPITTDQFSRPAKRPAFSALDHMALRINGFPPMRNWRDALEEFLKEC